MISIRDLGKIPDCSHYWYQLQKQHLKSASVSTPCYVGWTKLTKVEVCWRWQWLPPWNRHSDPPLTTRSQPYWPCTCQVVSTLKVTTSNLRLLSSPSSTGIRLTCCRADVPCPHLYVMSGEGINTYTAFDIALLKRTMIHSLPNGNVPSGSSLKWCDENLRCNV